MCGEGKLDPIVPSRFADGLECDSCHVRYPVRSGLPILIPEASVPPDRADSGKGVGWPNGDWRSRRRSRRAPGRIGRAANVLRTQGTRAFLQKAAWAVRTALERKLAVLRRGRRHTCPCCGSAQAFLTYRGRPCAQCPECGAKERDRLLIVVLEEVLEDVEELTNVLHVAPEDPVRRVLARAAPNYVATDLVRGLSSYAGCLSAASDLTCLPFRDDSFDLVVASHVLEHISGDRVAAREVHRVLRPGGVALLPVPITGGGVTIEYDEPNRLEEMHVRAPGLDYFDRFTEVGFDVAVKASADYPSEYQLHAHHGHREAGADQHVPVCVK